MTKKDCTPEEPVRLSYRLVLECLVALFIVFLLAYGIGMTVNSIEFVYGNY